VPVLRDFIGSHGRGVKDLDTLPGFIRATTRIQRVRDGQCTVHIVQFNSEAFDCSAYQLAGIDLPESVARSANRRKAGFFFGRLASSIALSEHGFAHYSVEIGDTREPLFPDGVVGSITHTDNLAAACVLPAVSWNGLGVDIESPIRHELLDHVEATVLSTEEKEVLSSCSAFTRSVLVALAFSAKESFYKAMSKVAGRFFDFAAVRLCAIDTRYHRLHFATSEALSSGWARGRKCEVDYCLLPDDQVLTVFGW
jgi:4'-phosphopantetheinyl transferase EntD